MKWVGMVRRAKVSLLIIVGQLLITGCASIHKLEKALFKDSTLNNLNPAPEKFSPPQAVGEVDLIDPVYTRSQADYHYTLGEALSLEGQTQKAIEEFKLTLIYDPKSVEVHVRLAAEYIRQGLMSEAIEECEMALEVDPGHLEARLLLAGLYSSLKMYDLAMRQYEHARIQFPENLDIPVYMGALLAEQGKMNEAEEVFMALATDPKNNKPAKAYYYIGRIRSESDSKQKWKSAESAYVKSLSLQPENSETVLALSRLYDKMERLDKALNILASYQDKFGPKKDVAQSLSVKYLEKEMYDHALVQLELVEGFEPENLNVKVKIALIYIEQKRFDQAIIKLEEVIRSVPESDKIRFYLGAVYEEVKNPKSAIFHFEQIGSSSVYYAEAVIHAAYLYKSMGNIDKSIEVIRAGIAARDDVPQFYTFYASLLDDKKEFNTAISMLEGATVKFPDHTQLRFFLGSMYDRIGQQVKTIENMRKVLQVDENHVQALNFLAYTFAENGENLREAEELAMKALGLSPKDGYVMDTMGWVLFKQGRVEESIKYLEAAHNNISNESIIAEHLGDAYYRHELIDKAKQMYLKAVAISKDEGRIREIRTKLSTIEKQQDLRRPASTQAR